MAPIFKKRFNRSIPLHTVLLVSLQSESREEKRKRKEVLHR